MKTIVYFLHHGMGSSEKKSGSLVSLLLDYLDCFIHLPTQEAIIPSLEYLNNYLETGGSEGGMGPGATWSPFSISSYEYDQLVNLLLSTTRENTKNPTRQYVPIRFLLDADINNQNKDADEWFIAAKSKYLGLSEIDQFIRNKKFSVFFDNLEIGSFEMEGYARGSKWEGIFSKNDAFDYGNFKIIAYDNGKEILVPAQIGHFYIIDNLKAKRHFLKFELRRNKLLFQTQFTHHSPGLPHTQFP